MKHFLVLIFSISISYPVFAQGNLNWTVLNTGTTKKINDIYFHGPDTGYIVGEDYLFKKTTDGGITWTDLTPPNIGEKPNNNGNIIGIDFHGSFSFSALDSGLYLSWEKGDHGISTKNEGLTYASYPYVNFPGIDSNQFCSVSGFSVLPANRGNGYIQLITYGQNCDADAVFSNYYDGPFSLIVTDTFKSAQVSKFTSVDSDSFSTIYGHSSGYLLRYKNILGTPDSIYLDSFGVSAIAYAGNNTWYAYTNRGSSNMYVSTDSGKTFSVDNSYNPNLFVTPSVNDFSFLVSGIGIAGAQANGNNGMIIVKDSNRWDLYSTQHPINTVKLFEDGTAIAAGDSGLFMKATILTSIKNHDTGSTFGIYPNPVYDYLHLEGLENLKVVGIQLYDIEGKLLQNFSSTERQLNLSKYPHGSYVIKVSTVKNKLSQKVIVR